MPPDNYPSGIQWPGAALEFYVYFNMPCAPVGDSAFDSSAAIKHGLNQQWTAANAEPDEHGGWVMHNPTTGQDSVWADMSVFRDRCNVDFSPVPPTWAGWVAVETWHTHIIKGGNPYGPNCRGHKATDLAPDGPGGADYLKLRDTGYPSILIDVDGVHVIHPPVQPGYPATQSGHVSWVDNCRYI